MLGGRPGVGGVGAARCGAVRLFFLGGFGTPSCSLCPPLVPSSWGVGWCGGRERCGCVVGWGCAWLLFALLLLLVPSRPVRPGAAAPLWAPLFPLADFGQSFGGCLLPWVGGVRACMWALWLPLGWRVCACRLPRAWLWGGLLAGLLLVLVFAPERASARPLVTPPGRKKKKKKKKQPL